MLSVACDWFIGSLCCALASAWPHVFRGFEKKGFSSMFSTRKFVLINGIVINGIFPAISRNKGCHSHQRLQPSKVSRWALRKLRAEKNTCHPAAIRLQPLPAMSPEETRDVKTQDTGPRELRCISKEWFQWAQTLASSQTKKSTKFLTLRDLVFFI